MKLIECNLAPETLLGEVRIRSLRILSDFYFFEENYTILYIMYLLIVFLPLLGSSVAGFFGRFLGSEGTAIITTTCVLFSSIFSFIAFYEVALGDIIGGISFQQFFCFFTTIYYYYSRLFPFLLFVFHWCSKSAPLEIHAGGTRERFDGQCHRKQTASSARARQG
jgi:hypothetical protein